jgi:DNA-binding MarR family transcriptional regulator
MPVAPDRRLVFLLNAGHRRVQRWIEAKMAAKGGLTAAQSGVLFFVGGQEGALIGEAAEALDLAPSAMTGLIDRMTRAELVERRPIPATAAPCACTSPKRASRRGETPRRASTASTPI